MDIKGIAFKAYSKPKVCVSITAKTFETFKIELEKIREKDVDVIEWRADYFEEDDHRVFSLLEKEQRPVIFTIRTKEEGGQWPYESENYFRRYVKAIDSNVIDVIDLEYNRNISSKKNLHDRAREKGVKIITSYHNFKKTPTVKEGVILINDLANDHGDFVKIAVMPNEKTDVLSLLEMTLQAKKMIKQPIISMAMGKTGVISRLLGQWSGSVLTFGALEDVSAPGQVELDTLNNILKQLEKAFFESKS